MAERYVIDTCAIIDYFDYIFGTTSSSLSATGRTIISDALSVNRPFSALPILIIPSIVFLEIFQKWFDNVDLANRIVREVYRLFVERDNIEIRKLDREVVEFVRTIRGSLSNHEINDKIVLATALILKCPLITNDSDIQGYLNQMETDTRLIY